jgi:hypothetical protein
MAQAGEEREQLFQAARRMASTGRDKPRHVLGGGIKALSQANNTARDDFFDNLLP